MNQKLIYLNHSGFILELDELVLIFDFFTDPAKCLPVYSQLDKTLVFFVSHDHPDHWVPEILYFEHKRPIYYILDRSCDTRSSRRAGREEGREIIFVDPGNIQKDKLKDIPQLLRIYVFGSNDEGCSFIIVTEQGSYIHLGDLNDWDWQDEDSPKMEADYRRELSLFKNAWAEIQTDDNLPPAAKELILSFVPVDGRLAETALKAALTFLNYLTPRYIVPMHLNGGNDLPQKLSERLKEKGFLAKTEVLSMTKPGQKLIINSR